RYRALRERRTPPPRADGRARHATRGGVADRVAVSCATPPCWLPSHAAALVEVLLASEAGRCAGVSQAPGQPVVRAPAPTSRSPWSAPRVFPAHPAPRRCEVLPSGSPCTGRQPLCSCASDRQPSPPFPSSPPDAVHPRVTAAVAHIERTGR